MTPPPASTHACPSGGSYPGTIPGRTGPFSWHQKSSGDISEFTQRYELPGQPFVSCVYSLARTMRFALPWLAGKNFQLSGAQRWDSLSLTGICQPADPRRRRHRRNQRLYPGIYNWAEPKLCSMCAVCGSFCRSVFDRRTLAQIASASHSPFSC